MPSVATVLESAMGAAYVVGYAIRLRYWRVQFSSTGLDPTSEALAVIDRGYKNRGMAPWLFAPSLLWLNHSDTFILSLLFIGLAAGVAAALQFYASLCIGIASIIYASFMAIHHPHFPVGGHRILANVGMLMFLCWLASASDELMLALVRCTYALIMFWSGVTKLYSDAGWRRFLHMDYHYWTQPLPSRLAYVLNSWPHWFHVASTFVSLVTELTCPLLAVWNPYSRALTQIACTALVVMINSVGHFGFFGGPLYVVSIAFFDDQAVAVLSQGVPSLETLLRPDMHWFTVLTPAAKIAFLLYVIVSVYCTIRMWPDRMATTMGSNAWYDLPMLSLLGSFLYSPYFFYWYTPKRRHEAVIEVRSGDGPWQEIHWRDASGALNKLSPATYGMRPIKTALIAAQAYGRRALRSYRCDSRSRRCGARACRRSCGTCSPRSGRAAPDS